MSDRNWRPGWRDAGRSRDARADEYREVSRRHYGDEEPWREERRARYPDEAYGGDRDAEWDRPRDRDEVRYGSAYEPSYGSPQPGRRPDSYARDDGRRGGSPSWRRERSREFDHHRPAHWSRDEREHADWWDRRHATGGFGSQYEGWRSGAGFGFGPEERPGGAGQFEDTDWIPNRPARGRGTWAGDWGLGRSGATHPRESRRADRDGYGPGIGDDYRGRGPRDYRRADDRIREEICDRLTDDYAIDASDLTIQVEGGEVTLSGFVATRGQKRRAEETAERVSGVSDVINQLRVHRGESPAPMAARPVARGQRSAASPAGVAADRDKPGGDSR